MTPAYYLIVDFEATCADNGTIPREQMEIIEIGAAVVQAGDLQPVDEFQCFIRPVREPELTAFCTKLTSIKQSDVDAAPAFPEAIESFTAWLRRYPDFVFCSWGDYDRNQLRQDCAFHKIPYAMGDAHINLKRLIAERQHLAKKPGLGDAIRLAGLEFHGTHHRGIDDVRNIVRLLPYIFDQERLLSHRSSQENSGGRADTRDGRRGRHG
jgi:inhibitor of KinA sporulation pathway (predicted exonuclease)